MKKKILKIRGYEDKKLGFHNLLTAQLRNIIIQIVIIPLLCRVYAQYTAEWTSGNLGSYGWGGAYGFDIDNDDLVEFEVKSSTQFTFYNGNYTVAWSISFSGYDYLNVFHPRDIDGNGILVPLNTDSDGAGELVIAGYYFSGSTYYGRFRVYDASSHTMEYESPLITGFYGSGTLEDIDGDGRDEIIITRFGSALTESYVVVYGYTTGIEEQSGTYEVRSEFNISPNPASNSVVIPIPNFHEEPSLSIKVRIYDETGRLVRNLPINQLTNSLINQLTWDGTDENGLKVPSGNYFVHIIMGKREYKNALKFVR